MSDSQEHFFLTVPEGQDGGRADKILADLLPGHTRSAIQSWMKSGLVMRNGVPLAQKIKLFCGDEIEVTVPQPELSVAIPQDIPLSVIHEDSEILVLNKPQELVVHPGAGNPDGTLMNALLHHYPDSASLPRAGIVHRLDKGTSGIMVVSKTEHSRQHLIEQLQNRSMSREYVAIIEGILISGKTIDKPIGRHRHDRLKMAVTANGKPAITHVRVLEKFRRHCLIQANLESGRTHQIRVHISDLGHAILGDKTYGSRNQVPRNADSELVAKLQNYSHQALHARKLSLIHPVTGEQLYWECPPPTDFDQLVKLLREDCLDQSNIR